MTEDQLQIYAEPITSLYYVRTKLPEDIFEKINADIDYILKNGDDLEKWNHNLAGNLEEEYKLSTKHSHLIEDFSLEVAKSYFQVVEDEQLNPTKRLDHSSDFFNKKVTYKVKSLWINFQKKYEFNPIHSHSGSYSFVIWTHIPYDLTEELNQKNSKYSHQPSNSLFEFHFSHASGILQSLPLYIDKSWEGTMIMFPSWLYHSVNPFYTTDNYRISISGNIDIKIENDYENA
jgi:hypothetical protein